MFSVVIACAGGSTRMQNDVNKVLLKINEKPIFMYSVDFFKQYTDDIIVVASKKDIESLKEFYPNVILGGKSRMESVYKGIIEAKYDKVFIHDGARPFLNASDFEKMIQKSLLHDVLFLGRKVVNSLKYSDDYRDANRDLFVEAYTPQFVLKKDYIIAYDLAVKENYEAKDDVSLINKELGKEVILVEGNENKKITVYSDYLVAKKLFETPRIGHSWDVHKLVKDRKLILGGIEIPYEKGLLGHSDADVLLHAIAESLLGALALGDLGKLFPDNDKKTEGISSTIILEKAYSLVKEHGYQIGNIDAMIYAEEPKLQPYILAIRTNVAKILNVEVDQISVKATTYEKMAEIGRKEAMASEAVCILYKG